MKQLGNDVLIDDDIRHTVLHAVKGENSAVMLFGSVARGDASPLSDIDVLQLSDRRTRPYKVGRTNVSVYDEATLLGMAHRGSLFVLHLRDEGQILRDSDGRLRKCLEAYQPQSDYEPYRRALRETANLLDVPKEEYKRRWKAYNEVAMFLLRSTLYAHFAEAGNPVFSLAVVQQRLERPDVADAFTLKSAPGPCYREFVVAGHLLSEFLRATIRNPFGTVEALVTNTGMENPLMLAFGLRLLGRKDFELSYDLLLFPPFG
jgi:hypothetical protein